MSDNGNIGGDAVQQPDNGNGTTVDFSAKLQQEIANAQPLLQHVETSEKGCLPTAQDIAQEKTLSLLENQELKQQLRQVETVERNTLPSQQEIDRERELLLKEQQSTQ